MSNRRLIEKKGEETTEATFQKLSEEATGGVFRFDVIREQIGEKDQSRGCVQGKVKESVCDYRKRIKPGPLEGKDASRESEWEAHRRRLKK